MVEGMQSFRLHPLPRTMSLFKSVSAFCLQYGRCGATFCEQQIVSGRVLETSSLEQQRPVDMAGRVTVVRHLTLLLV